MNPMVISLTTKTGITTMQIKGTAAKDKHALNNEGNIHEENSNLTI